MKKFLRKFASPVLPLIRTRLMDYRLVARSLEEFLVRQESFVDRLTWRSHLPPKLIKTLIGESATILTFSTLLGLDIAGLKGAAIGSAVGAIIVVGNVLIQIIFVRTRSGIEMELMGG